MSPRLPRVLAGLLLLSLPVLVLLSVRSGSSGVLDWQTLQQGLLASFGWDEPLAGTQQSIVELRLWRALTAAGVGAALALSGALLQGLFRNGLASPSLLGVTGGASLGATLAILLLSGAALGEAGPLLQLQGGAESVSFLVPAAAFLGALASVLFVALLSSGAGRVSVPTLLLTGIAVNTCLAGVLALISALMLDDWEVSRAILAWTFGTLDDRGPGHVQTVWLGVLVASAVLPFLSWELDLLQTGEDDARALGVATGRVRLLAVVASSLAAAAAVAVAGQIAFVGLVVPHLVRLLVGRSHKRVLPLSLLLGAHLLLGVDCLQRALLGASSLPPGVTMSLIGGPFFLGLLIFQRREVDSW
ncbi:MAG: FecCD family ABC transporter permease [Planctomycetota bacterium]